MRPITNGELLVEWDKPGFLNKSEYSTIRELANKEDLYIRSVPKTNDDTISLIQLFCSNTPVLAKILDVGNNGVKIKPTPEYKYILEDLYQDYRLTASPIIVPFDMKTPDDEGCIVMGVHLNIVLGDKTARPL